MLKYIMVADDLTGANANCSLLKKLGFNVVSLFKPDHERAKMTDALAYSTDSRAIAPTEAYKRVKQATEALKMPKAYYNKRIDSTLRGNLGAEIDGILDGLAEPDRVAVVVPAYPDSGRIVVNKTMLVNGKLLTESDAGHDPKMPVKTNNVEALVTAQTKYPHVYITLEEVTKGVEALAKKLKASAKDARIIILDAVRNEDVEIIAKAVVKSGLKIVTVDPGPFTMLYARELQFAAKTEQKILMVIGSVTDLTRQQIEYTMQEKNVFLTPMNVANFFTKEGRQKEIDQAVNHIKKQIDKSDLFLLTTTPLGREEKLDLGAMASKMNISIDDASKLISNTLTEAAEKVLLETGKIKGIYCSGGDVSLSLFERLGVAGVDVREEVIPLAVYSRLLGGKLPNLKVVTKGGMVGDKTAISICLNKMKQDEKE
jgi:uncharacterized protein YgbK (DUF1537 family)